MRTRMSILLTLTLSLLLIPVLGGTQRPSATESQPDSPRIQNASATPAEGVTATIAVGAIPAALALDETTGKLYVANFGSDSVSVIDAASLTVVSEIDVGISPLAIAVHPARHRVYVLNQGSNSVSVIDSETQRLETTVAVGARPRSMALDIRGDVLYVANTESTTLAAIDGHTLQVSNIPVGEGPVALALDDWGHVYVANLADNTVSIVEATTGAVTQVSVGKSPVSLAYNAVNRCVYVAHAEEKTVYVIQAESGQVIDVLPVNAKAALAADPFSGETYLAEARALVVVDSHNRPLEPIKLPHSPWRVMPDPQNGNVYVSHWKSNAVSIVDVATGQIETRAVGANPSEIAVDSQRKQVFVINTAYPAAGEDIQPSTVSVLDASPRAAAGLESGPTLVAMTAAPHGRAPALAPQAAQDNQWMAVGPPPTIPSNYVSAVAEASDGAMWFGTSSGASRFDGNTWTTFTSADGLAHDFVKAIEAGSGGVLWFGTGLNGVSRFDGSTWTTFTSADGLVSNDVDAIAEASDGALWFATSSGASRFDGSTWTNFTSADGLASNYVYDVAAAPGGTMWFATSSGVSRFDGNTWTTYTSADGLASNYVYAVAVATDGALWFGTSSGVSRFDGNTWTTYTSADGLASNYVYAVTATSDGALWFGTSIGVSHFDGSSWTTYTTVDGLASNDVNAIAGASDGTLWFSTYRGASRFDGNTWSTYVASDFVTVAVAADDTVWIGGPSGVWHFDKSAWISYTVADGLVHNNVQAITATASGALWFGTSAGVSRFYTSAWTTYTTTHGLAGNDVRAIAAASDGALWFGTGGNGVSRFGGSTWTTYTTTHGLANANVRAIAAASDGVMWFGTSGGVSRFDGSTWTTYTSGDGLARDYVSDIAVTADGQVWAFHGSYTFSVFDGSLWTILTWKNSPLTGGYGLDQDQAGNIWYAIGSFLKGYDGLKEYAFSPSADVSFSDLALDSLGNKWVVDRKGLWRFDGTLAALKQGTHVISDRSFLSAWKAGLQFVQIPIRWSELEPAQGEYDFGFLYYLHRQNWRYYLHPVLRIFAAPAWARPTGSTETGPPNDPQYLEDLMRALVTEFGSSFSYVIWNEPNLPAEWGGQTPNAVDYVALLRAAYQGAKSANPWAKVVSAGLAPTAGGSGAVRDIDFLTQMYDAGLADYCDAVGMNGLGFSYSPDNTSDPNGYNFSRLADVRQVMVDKGDNEKKAWLLEVGWMRNSDVDLGGYNWYKVSEQQQAAYLARAIDKARSEWPWVEAMFLWNLDYDRFLPQTDQMYWFSFGQGPGYLAVAPNWRPYFHNQCGVTNQARPVLRGSAPPRSAIHIYLGGAPLLTTTATYSSTFTSAVTTDLSAGAHRFSATVTNPLSGESSTPSVPLALTVDPSLPYDPVGVNFSYRHPGSSRVSVRVPKSGDGCAVPDDWSVSLPPGVATAVNVPVNCAGSADVNFTYGSNTIALSDSGNGLYQGIITPTDSETSFAIEVTCGGDTTTGSGTLLTEPDGVVYDAAKGTDAPLAGVTVTCERWENSLGVWTLWDAWNYAFQDVTQENPLLTGVDGLYSFMVPPGMYIVTAVKEGYAPFTSAPLMGGVTPVHLKIPLRRSVLYLPLILRHALTSTPVMDR